MTREETFAGMRPWQVTAHYFELLAAPIAVDVKIFADDGRVLADDKGVRLGYFHDRRGLEPFVRVEITNPSSQTVKGLFSDGLSGTKSFSPQWYDAYKNPLVVSNGYHAQSVAPHAATSRWSYTVPANRKFVWQIGFCEVVRMTAAGAAAGVLARIEYTPSGGAASHLLLAEHISNAVDGGRNISLGTTAVLLAGDKLEGFTSDVSTGGTNMFAAAMQGIEFDA